MILEYFFKSIMTVSDICEYCNFSTYAMYEENQTFVLIIFRNSWAKKKWAIMTNLLDAMCTLVDTSPSLIWYATICFVATH